MDNEHQGWEEAVDASLTHLLKTSLAKSVKDSSAVQQPLAMPKDTSKLKRHIQIVCDRLSKGASLSGKPRNETQTAPRPGQSDGGPGPRSSAGVAAADEGKEGSDRQNRSSLPPGSA